MVNFLESGRRRFPPGCHSISTSRRIRPKVPPSRAEDKFMHELPVPPVSDEHPIAARSALSALIVDDERHVRTYLHMILENLGLSEIQEAANGREALELYRQRPSSVVLLDINMPFVSGQDTLIGLMAINPSAAIMVVSSQNDLTTVRQFQTLGAMGFVLKHGSYRQVTAALEEGLDRLLAGSDEE
ncbi:MAG: response regulator [Opitutus sp.]|nr:response regulator [Opitutus sp.]